MYIKNLIGARKGEIEDFPFEIAKQKVEAGEAEDVYGQLPKPVTASTADRARVVVVQPAAVSTRVDEVSVNVTGEVNVAKKKAGRR